ncbi:AAA family ATPase [Bradyrhizobium manausense]|uniref:Rad50/SbcC-type AAA domain-containing protein n=1 Tax=Bradyrhizobium manausense TaxID=989370 RepID=A0A0R3DGZ1_9BRAD|nr:AAA family ATPase [Bradyrhizobium manausense]KRQ09158.1 hypothetical protein AOQ71_21245 [Bradyrhizobium manausense]
MTRYYLSKISIEGFRGINNDGDPLVIKFKPNAVNSIHAHNGVGKTSIFEAIHFAIFGDVPRLKRLQGAEHPESYVANKFHPSGEALVELCFEPDDGSAAVEIAIKRDAAGRRLATSRHPDPEKFLRELRQDFVLVDYTKFSDFVDASALERGRSFSSLVGLSAYSELRQLLEGASDTRTLNTDFDLRALQTDKTAREREVSEGTARALAAYAEITGQSATDLSDIESLCRIVSKALQNLEILKPVVGTSDVRNVDIAAAEKLVEKEEGGPMRARHAKVLKSITDLQALAAAGDEAEERRNILQLATDRDTAMTKAGSAALRVLYENAKEVVSDSLWDRKLCPVCDSKLDRDLLDHLKDRISQYAAADAANDKLGMEIRRVSSVVRFGNLEAAPEMGIALADRGHSAILQAADDQTLSTVDLQAVFARLDSYEQTRAAKLSELEKERVEIEGKLPPSLVAVSKMLAAVKEFCGALSAREKAAKALADVAQNLAVSLRWQDFITQAKNVFSGAENALANQRIGEIEAEYQTLFAALVRGGPDVRPTLERAAGSENIDLKLADFHGLAGVNARAVLSESYRNAVAASIFLAAASKYNGTPRFVILDDVTSSFDAGHQFSLMEAIRTKLQQPANANGLQFIILSHDSALEKYFDKQNGTADWSHQKLQGMPPIGRVMVSAQEADRLKVQAQNLLNAGQVDLGAPFVRQYLEYKLGHIISKLEIPCPPDYATRGDKRTLSTYLDAIVDAVDLYQAAGRCVLSAQQMADIKNTHVPSIVGNFVSHYETGSGTPFGAYALLGVLQSIDALADCFTWTDSSQSPPIKRFYKRLNRQ